MTLHPDAIWNFNIHVHFCLRQSTTKEMEKRKGHFYEETFCSKDLHIWTKSKKGKKLYFFDQITFLIPATIPIVTTTNFGPSNIDITETSNLDAFDTPISAETLIEETRWTSFFRGNKLKVAGDPTAKILHFLESRAGPNADRAFAEMVTDNLIITLSSKLNSYQKCVVQSNILIQGAPQHAKVQHKEIKNFRICYTCIHHFLISSI